MRSAAIGYTASDRVGGHQQPISQAKAGHRLQPRRGVTQFFFFQAEDGIRDYKVTGVQTCALPIFLRLMVAVVFVDSGWNHLKNPVERSKSIGASPRFTVFLGTAEVAGSIGVALGEIGRASCRERV